jgi:hypothetical protein
MYYDVMKQLKKDFILRYCNYPVMFEYRRLEFLNNWRRTRWLIKLFLYIDRKRLKYHQFYKKVIHESQYDFMKIVRKYISNGDGVMMIMMHRFFFITHYKQRKTKLRYQYLLKDTYLYQNIL